MPKFEKNQGLIDQYAKVILAAGGTKDANFDNVEIRDMNNVGFKDGEIFKVDASQRYIRKVTAGGRTNDAPLLLVTMEDGSIKELYLSMLSRSVPVCDEAGKITNQVEEASGSAVAEWKKYRVASEGVKALDGKYIKVKNRRQPWRLAPNAAGEMKPRRQVVYDFVFCDENGTEIAATN